jgi:hypothetical protein
VRARPRRPPQCGSRFGCRWECGLLYRGGRGRLPLICRLKSSARGGVGGECHDRVSTLPRWPRPGGLLSRCCPLSSWPRRGWARRCRLLREQFVTEITLYHACSCQEIVRVATVRQETPGMHGGACGAAAAAVLPPGAAVGPRELMRCRPPKCLPTELEHSDGLLRGATVGTTQQASRPLCLLRP